jgi:predicted phosphodiesterase
MANPFWSESQEAELLKLSSAGLSPMEIAVEIGKSIDSVRAKLSRLMRSGTQPVHEEVKEEVVEFENVALKSEVADLKEQVLGFQEKSAAGEAGVVLSEWKDDWNGDDVWAKVEKQGIKDINKSRLRGKFNVNFPTGPIAIACISDQHIAPGTACDFKRMREDAELIHDTPGLYACLAGDGVDNHIKIQQATLSARSTPSDQWRLFDHYLKIFGVGKILVVISGNHDAWTVQIGGVDYLSQVAENNKLCYAPAEARLKVTVGGQDYDMMIRHQVGRFNSSLNQTHVVKRFWEMNEAPFDIGVIGHHHEAALEAVTKHSKRIYVARPGSYQITTQYSHQYGFSNSIPTCPTFILFPGERRIIGFDDVRDAVWALKGARGE